MANLYRLTQETLDLQARLLASVDNDTGEVDSEIAGYLTEKQDQLEAAVTGCVQIKRGVDATIVEIEAEINRLTEIKKRYIRISDGIKNSVKTTMEATGTQAIKNIDCTVALHKSPPSAKVYNELLLPDEYWRVVERKTPDLTKIGEALKAGKEVAGATLETDNTHVVIK